MTNLKAVLMRYQLQNQNILNNCDIICKALQELTNCQIILLILTCNNTISSVKLSFCARKMRQIPLLETNQYLTFSNQANLNLSHSLRFLLNYVSQVLSKINNHFLNLHQHLSRHLKMFCILHQTFCTPKLANTIFRHQLSYHFMVKNHRLETIQHSYAEITNFF